jgi:hypothetical protein
MSKDRIMILRKGAHLLFDRLSEIVYHDIVTGDSPIGYRRVTVFDCGPGSCFLQACMKVKVIMQACCLPAWSLPMVFAHKGDAIGRLRANRTEPPSRARSSPKGFASCPKGLSARRADLSPEIMQAKKIIRVRCPLARSSKLRADKSSPLRGLKNSPKGFYI